MPCLLALMAAFFPRIGLLVVWLARPGLVSAAFNTVFWPILGFIFLPFTTLFYVLLYKPGIGLYPIDWLWIGLAFLLDLSHWFGSYTQRKTAMQMTTGGPAA